MTLSATDNQKTDQNPWYLLAAKPKQEFRALEQLQNQKILAFCPKIKVEKLRRGKKCVVEEALFAGYLFVCISMDSPNWYKVRSTRGVRDWVKFGGEIAKLPRELAQQLIELDQNLKQQPVLSRFNQGQKVRILSGPFAGLKAIYQQEDGESRSLILVEFLGQSNRLKVENEQITND
ncbi:MAG: transcription/translation regulatory transformer protein RfaH [Enterobacterales bacterium]|nr:transcription/translation regulatory transformer protein RfaH [Enterobacterales bacterium]